MCWACEICTECTRLDVVFLCHINVDFVGCKTAFRNEISYFTLSHITAEMFCENINESERIQYTKTSQTLTDNSHSVSDLILRKTIDWFDHIITTH